MGQRRRQRQERLVLLALSGKERSQADIVRLTGLPRSTTSVTLDRLIATGLVGSYLPRSWSLDGTLYALKAAGRAHMGLTP